MVLSDVDSIENTGASDSSQCSRFLGSLSLCGFMRLVKFSLYASVYFASIFSSFLLPLCADVLHLPELQVHCCSQILGFFSGGGDGLLKVEQRS